MNEYKNKQAIYRFYYAKFAENTRFSLGKTVFYFRWWQTILFVVKLLGILFNVPLIAIFFVFVVLFLLIVVILIISFFYKIYLNF